MWVCAGYVEQLKIGKGLPGEHIKLIRASPIEKRQASTIAANRHFYESIPCEHILFHQADGLMLRSPDYALPGAIHAGPQLLDMIHNYIYLGAPWNWCNDGHGERCRMGGNGGMSYRQRSVMLDFTREITCTDWRCDWSDLYTAQQDADDWYRVEDMNFAQKISEHKHKYAGRIATQAQANEFCQETLEGPDDLQLNPWFVHKIWMYITHKKYIPIMSRVKQFYPELWKDKK